MFYVAYNKKNVEADKRPVTFLFNGGPGSSTVWLHMGAFGPKRVITADDTHTAAAPYQVVNNDYSLLDASDLVFVDAPGTGFSRIAVKIKKKNFTAWTRTRTRSRNSSWRISASMGGGTRPSTFSVKATEHRAPPCW
jgi:Carboxypeptidase C (cathepsin A)